MLGLLLNQLLKVLETELLGLLWVLFMQFLPLFMQFLLPLLLLFCRQEAAQLGGPYRFGESVNPVSVSVICALFIVLKGK